MLTFLKYDVSFFALKFLILKIFYRLFTNITNLWFPNSGRLGYLMSQLGQLCKITTRSVKFSGKNSRILISKDDKIVYNYFFGKLKFLINHKNFLNIPIVSQL